MATGAGWQPPPYGSSAGSSKYNTSPTASMFYDGGVTLEYTQDLHLKMSKKIAQLTKVIYALNTKNDEHEEEIESLKEAHEDEVQHIVTETRDKIMQYKSKMVDEADLRRRLANLEESVELHEHMKRQALAEFEMYRQRMEDSQLCTEAQHTQRVVSMSREVEEMRRDFEEKLRAFSQAQTQFEADKRRALEELRAIHRQEVDDLLNKHQNQSASSTEDQEKLAELHRQEVDALMERVEELTKDKVRLVEEYEAKLAKAQECYERELEAMRRTHQLTTENLLAWKRTELRKEFQAQEAALQRSLSKLRSELQKAQEEARENRDKTNRLQTSLANAERTIKVCSWLDSQIGSLQATQMSHEATIRNLDQEQNRLKEKISRLEEEREALLNQSQASNEQHKQQVLKLEQSLREEHQGYERELSRLRATYEEEMLRFKEAQVRTLEEMEEKHQAMTEEKLSQEFEIKLLSLEEQRNRLQQQLDNLKEELSAKLNMANQEVSHLQELVREKEQNLGSAQTQINCLRETQEKLKIELDATRSRVRETSNLLTDLQEEIDSQRQQHEARVMSIRTEEKQKMDKMANDLDQKWRDALRYKNIYFISQLISCVLFFWHPSASHSCIVCLSVCLSSQISLLKQSLELQLSQSQSALQQLQSQFNQERELLSQQMKGKRWSFKCCTWNIRISQNDIFGAFACLQRCRENIRGENTALEERLKQEQREEVHALKEAHRRTLDILRQQSEQELQTLRFELEDEGKAKLASLRAELNHLHASSIEHLKQIHLKENSAAKRELESAMEHRHKQEQELLARISDLQAEVCSRNNRITDLDHEIHSLNETIDTLTRELELKGKEVLRVRSEANQQIRAHEQDLSKRHERDLGELSVVHHRETHIMLADFNKAQEVLRDKISALQILLEGTEEKLRNRESRPEDLHVIAELREMVSEREALVKKLVDDKKFYQLELVNRETGFSKVFNSSANVGVINPLIKVSGLQATGNLPIAQLPPPNPPSENRKALSLFSHCSPLPQHPPSPHPSHLPMPSFAPPPPQEVLGQNQGPQSFRR
uniref:Family with sequence similarity 184 member Aa n=1 Tax=Takifugu rubripes TaxID=31033 RepID=A0A674PIY8_TAKRU